MSSGNNVQCTGDIIRDGTEALLKLNMNVEWPPAPLAAVGFVATVTTASSDIPGLGVSLRLPSSKIKSLPRQSGETWMVHDTGDPSLDAWPYTQVQRLRTGRDLTDTFQLLRQLAHNIDEASVQWVITDISWVIPY